MPQRHKPVTVRPRDGGMLMTNLSAEVPGIANYTQKQDFRRDIDQEIRREGHDYFWPHSTNQGGVDYTTNPGNQPFPNLTTLRTLAGADGDSLTRSGTTATMTLAKGHSFVEGETVLVSGANQAAYNGSFPIKNVTKTTFQYTMLSDPGATATGTITVRSDMPINLVHRAQRPNGQTAVIVGTATTLFRFFALDNPAYVETTGSNTPYIELVGSNTPYWEEQTGAWIIIAQGFSVSGQRWEAKNINGYAIFNNGVDLPVTYRVEEISAKPIYELREQGIASVGVISEIDGIMICGDISEIFDASLKTILTPINSGNVTATQAGSIYSGATNANQAQASTTVIATNANFNGGLGFVVGMVGKYLRFINGFTRQITAVNSNVNVTVAGPAPTNQNNNPVGGLPFYVVDLSVSSPDFVVTASGAFFTEKMVGQTILFNNTLRTIRSFISSTQVRVDSDLTLVVKSGVGSITSLSGTATFTSTTNHNLTTGQRVKISGCNETDYNGNFEITALDEKKFTYAVPNNPASPATGSPAWTDGVFEVTNPDAYAAFTDQSKINRIQYRALWAIPDEPRRFAAVYPARSVAGSNQLLLDYPVKSLDSGKDILILGAGANGANLTTNAVYVFGRYVLLSVAATTSNNDADAQLFDSVGSIVGFSDIEDDSSPIINMMPLRGYLVVYKDTSIFLGQYTGQPTAPFKFTRVYRGSKNLYYKNTLLDLNGDFHIYAGKNAFYTFDLTTQRPKESESSELCQSIFFDQVKIEDQSKIFAAENAITKEVFLCFPSSTSDKALCFDYLRGTFSTSTATYTAGATIKRPLSGIAVGAQEEWFVTGTSAGVVLQYGKTNAARSIWSNAKEIFYRREAWPFNATKQSYTSILRSGLADFGDSFNEKTLESYVLYLASQSPNCSVLFELYSTRNTASAAALLGSLTISSPITENLVPMFFLANYFQDKLTITGVNNPCRIAARTFNVSGVRSESFTRRPTS